MSAAPVVGPQRRRAGVVCALVIALIVGIPVSASARGGELPPRSASQPIAVVVPIVSSSLTNGLIGRDELAAKTDADGGWTLLANAAWGVGATIALDSRIVATITVLGDDAPQSARSWLTRVTAARHLLLPWGNADPFLLATTGTENRVSTIQLSELAGVPANDIVGWPTGRAGREKSAHRVANLGFSRLIASDAVFPDGSGTYSHYWSNVIGKAIAPDSSVTVASVVDALRTTKHRPRAIVLPRNPSALDPTHAVEFLRLAFGDGLNAAPYLPPSTVDLGLAVVAHKPTQAIRALLDQHRLDRLVSEAGTDPAEIAIPRLASVCVLAGLVDSPRFDNLVRTFTRTADNFGDVATVRTGTPVTVLANSADIPVTVVNNSQTDLTLTARVHATTGIIGVSRSLHKLTIATGSSVQFTVPVATIANGTTALAIQLETTTGTPIGHISYIPVYVQAQWESITLVAFIGIVGLIMGIGVTRQVRERRRR